MLVLLAFILYFAQLALSLHSKNNQVYQDMSGTKKNKTALVSVFHKDGLDELLAKLNAEGVKFLSTGGTRYDIPLNPGWTRKDTPPQNIRRHTRPPRQRGRP